MTMELIGMYCKLSLYQQEIPSGVKKRSDGGCRKSGLWTCVWVDQTRLRFGFYPLLCSQKSQFSGWCQVIISTATAAASHQERSNHPRQGQCNRSMWWQFIKRRVNWIRQVNQGDIAFWGCSIILAKMQAKGANGHFEDLIKSLNSVHWDTLIWAIIITRSIPSPLWNACRLYLIEGRFTSECINCIISIPFQWNAITTRSSCIHLQINVVMLLLLRYIVQPSIN